ncbi:MAG TPA: hypothetical protein VHM88_20575 [Candidatus Acidoferrales bacterium]|nr:hypothetical protein [Candidatus Acidoferrales bacterium]
MSTAIEKLVELAATYRKHGEAALWAAYEAGLILRGLDRSKGGDPSVAAATVAGASEYAEAIRLAGISERTAQRWQELAEEKKEQLEAYIAQAKKEGWEVSGSGASGYWHYRKQVVPAEKLLSKKPNPSDWEKQELQKVKDGDLTFSAFKTRREWADPTKHKENFRDCIPSLSEIILWIREDAAALSAWAEAYDPTLTEHSKQLLAIAEQTEKAHPTAKGKDDGTRTYPLGPRFYSAAWRGKEVVNRDRKEDGLSSVRTRF